MIEINGEPYCPNYRCGDCGQPRPCRRRVDGESVQVARPWFLSQANPFPCSDFFPSDIHVFDLAHYWIDYESWYADWLLEWKNGISKEDFEKSSIGLCLNGDNSIRYHVKMKDWIYGTLFDGDTLRAFKKEYYERTRSGFGYRLIHESINGVEIKTR